MRCSRTKKPKAPLRRRLLGAMLRVLLGVASICTVIWLVVAQPTFRGNKPSQLHVSSERLREHVAFLCGGQVPRDWHHSARMADCAGYVVQEFRNAGATTSLQTYEAGGYTYHNAIGRFGNTNDPTIIVGAHYDVPGNVPGADDNASGVAVLIEIAGLLAERPVRGHCIELVAYTLEEPPFFNSDLMGSAQHAAAMVEDGRNVVGAIVLEMVGYFSDDWGSQKYPALMLKLFYPHRGNFIAVVSRLDQGDWVKEVKVGMKGTTGLPVYSLRAPARVPGVDLSDHRNYMPKGIPALMVTDTAFYRNEAYHTPDDTPDRLDYEKMADVAVAVTEALLRYNR